MRTFRFLFTVAVLVAALAAFVGVAAAQQPPVGNPPEPDDDLQHQIADMLMGSASAQSAGPVEEDPALWDLFKQQQPDLTFTLSTYVGAYTLAVTRMSNVTMAAGRLAALRSYRVYKPPQDRPRSRPAARVRCSLRRLYSLACQC